MFVPKNIEKRQEDLKVLKAKKAYELEELCQRLTKSLSKLRHKKFVDLNKMFFIHTLTNCKVQVKHKRPSQDWPSEVFFLDKSCHKYIASYDQKSGEFYISYQNVWKFFESNHRLNYHSLVDLIKAWIKEHLNIEPLKISTRTYVDLSGQRVIIETYV